jgi:hypothetical protein
LDDNPYLSGGEYRIALLNLPPEEREALLRGRWDAIPVKGAYYAELMAKMRRDGRITKVPYQQGSGRHLLGPRALGHDGDRVPPAGGLQDRC